MKLVISTALLVFLAGLPAYALQEPGQDKEKDKPKPAQQEEPKKQEPERRAPQAQEKERQQPDRQQEKQQQKDAQKQESQKQERDQADRTRQTDRAQQQDSKQQQQAEKDRAKQDKASQEHQQQVQRDQHNNVQQSQRDGGNHNVRRIRQEDFTAHFGREHRFHVERRDDRRFNYGGYWFQFSDPWPSAWSYDDDVYVDDIDGEYYLIDPARPGIRILLVVAD